MGDLSENGDYHAAKDEQGHMEGRIRHLEHMLDTDNHVIVEPNSDGSIGPGSIVTIVYEGDDDDEAERYLVGHPEEQTDGLEVMSPQSPLGSALLGKAEGDWVEYQAPRGPMRVKVLEVETA
jgi:transcription elongation factor GreA